MALSGLDIYKLLPKTNCRQCGVATCLAFAMQLAKKTVLLEKCPFVAEESKNILEAQALPPIKQITIGKDESAFELGNETVLFRHEEKFRNPSGIGFIIEDTLTDAQIIQHLEKINSFKFERVGQELKVNLVALKFSQNEARYLEIVKLVLKKTQLPLMLVCSNLEVLRRALELTLERSPVISAATKENLGLIGKIAQEFGLPLVVSAGDITELARMTEELKTLGVKDLILDTGDKPLNEKIWDLTQIRRQALKKSNRALGYPCLAVVKQSNSYQEAMETCAYIAKYAGIILIQGLDSWEILSILTLRQDLYSDPQKPLQIDPKIYAVGMVTSKSPVLITTNFSLTYYTVLAEVETSKVPAYILSIDTQGMSVLTAWAAEKFSAEYITKALNNAQVKELVSHNNLIIPGYVAMISGDLEEHSGFNIIVGPKEAAGIPSFLKKLG